MKKSVILLGSTGSIGRSAARVVREFRDDFQIYGLGCSSSLDILEEQIREFHPAAAAVASPEARKSSAYAELKERYADVDFIESRDPVQELASRNADITLSSIVGAAGLLPSMAALKSAGRVALANKETLVMAGDLFMSERERLGTELIPVDSEHSAIFSLLEGRRKNLRRIIITASGGSLRNMPQEELAFATPEQVLAHPTWKMGSKITVDSATMMNKGFEVIEAHHLFSASYDEIEVVLHGESRIHSMIETMDGSVYAHMGEADMALPILNSFFYPEKKYNSFGRMDFTKPLDLHFRPWSADRYPALALCWEAGRTGGTMPAVVNGSNEEAVRAFLDRKIRFTDIQRVVESAAESCPVIQSPGLDDILEADRQAREAAGKIIRGICL